MNEKNLYPSLSQAAREDDREAMSKLDERWDRLAAGTLTEAENDELLGLADASGEAHEAYQAFRPLGPDFQKNVAAAILARQRQEREEARYGAGAGADADRALAPPVGLPTVPPLPHPRLAASPERPRQRRFQRWAAAAGVVVALAVSLLLQQEQKAGFQVEVTHQQALGNLRRGSAEASESAVFQAGRPFEVLARAQKGGAPAVAGRFYLFQDGHLAPLGEPLAERGNLAASGQVPALPGFTAGEGVLVFVFAPPGQLPADAEVQAALAAGAAKNAAASAGFELATKSVWIQPEN